MITSPQHLMRVLNTSKTTNPAEALWGLFTILRDQYQLPEQTCTTLLAPLHAQLLSEARP